MVKLTQNLPLAVHLPEDGGQHQYEGVLFGGIEGECLIAGGFAGQEFEAGTELIARTVVQGHVMGFWCTVEQRIEEKGGIYLLSFPRQFEELELRKSDRINVIIPAELEMELEGGTHVQRFSGVLVNLSDDGACLCSKDLPAAPGCCTIRFSLPGRKGVYELSGKVVRKTGEDAEGIQLGMEFSTDRKYASAKGDIRDWVRNNFAQIVMHSFG